MHQSQAERLFLCFGNGVIFSSVEGWNVRDLGLGRNAVSVWSDRSFARSFACLTPLQCGQVREVLEFLSVGKRGRRRRDA